MSESFKHDLKGVKSSTSLHDLIKDADSQTVKYMLMSSFYLPTDILQSAQVKVLPVRVITGEEFKLHYFNKYNTRCDLFPEVLCKARYVGVSVRWLVGDAKNVYTVCKLWYGLPPKGVK